MTDTPSLIVVIEENFALRREVQKLKHQYAIMEQSERTAHRQLSMYNECYIAERQRLIDRIALLTKELEVTKDDLNQLRMVSIQQRRQAALDKERLEYQIKYNRNDAEGYHEVDACWLFLQFFSPTACMF